jgi:hypothetical protein
MSGQLARTSTNPTSPEVNDHISLKLFWGLWDSNWWSLESKLKTWPVELYPLELIKCWCAIFSLYYWILNFSKKYQSVFYSILRLKTITLNLKNLNFDLRYTCIVSSINYIKNMLLELFKEKINLISIYILNNLKIFIITHVKPKKKKTWPVPIFQVFNPST